MQHILVDHAYPDKPDVWLFSKAMPWVSYNCRTYWPSVAEYVAGETKPNYPMPALPMEVDIFPDYCAVFVWRGPEQTGQYCHCVISNNGDTD